MNETKKILIVCDKSSLTSFGRLALDISHALSLKIQSENETKEEALGKGNESVLGKGGKLEREKKLTLKNFDADILWLTSNKKSKIERGFLKTISFIASFLKNLFSFRKKLRKALQKKSYDIVFFIRPELGFLISTAKRISKKITTIVFVHDTFAETLYPGSFKFFLVNHLLVCGTETADTFVYNSEWTKKSAQDYFGEPKIIGKVIGCPVRNFTFSQGASSKENSERKNEISTSAIFSREEKLNFWSARGIKNFAGVCLNVSLDEPRKNLATFFELAKMRPDVAFVRVGRLRKKTREKLSRLKLSNLFHFEGISDSELENFYRHADLTICPSLLEGFGLTPLESLACGTPAIASRTSALEENLLGVVPLIENPLDKKAYEKILDEVLSGKNIVNCEAKKNLLEKCSINAFAKRLQTALTEALD